ncbi:MAG TPA: NfeD family protein [Campylobacterales bacterium]|nr:NfeD family protein [Campylobacterales bacterium]
MLEFLSQNLLWWHWIIFGILLITTEIFIGTFFMLGLGVAAILVGSVDGIYPVHLEIELLLWMLFSLISIFIWFKYLKDTTEEKSGQSDYALDAQGSVEESIVANGRGKVKFDTPVLGNTEWHATAKQDIPTGRRVKIVQIKGQLIEVETL